MTVYFIQSGDDGPIKIGYSHSFTSRLDQLQTGNPEPLTVLAVADGSQRVEARIHADLAADRYRLEWFKPSAAVLAMVDRALRNDLPAAYPEDASAAHIALLRAIDAVGCQISLSRLSGVSQSSISKCVVRQLPCHANWVARIAVASGIPEHELRAA